MPVPDIVPPDSIPEFLGPWGAVVMELSRRVNLLGKPETDGTIKADFTEGNFRLTLGSGTPTQATINVNLVINGQIIAVQLVLAQTTS